MNPQPHGVRSNSGGVPETVKTGRLTTRLLRGPALRFQPDARLVSLVRDGYESAFEEIKICQFRAFQMPAYHS